MSEKFKLRLEFEKTGRIRFISHLDLLRVMQRLFKRAGVPLWHSEGFNPHPYLNFLQPMPLGIEGLNEPLDIRIEGDMSFKEIKSRLNAVMPEGIEIVDVLKPEHKPNEIAAAEYEIDVYFSNPAEAEGFAAGAESVIRGGVLNAEKRSKRGIKTVNLCELVRSFETEVCENKVRVKTILAAGNTVNLNAELLMTALYGEFAADPEKTDIVRTRLLREDLSIFE